MNLPAIHNQGPVLRVDSREVARFFEVEHRSLARLIHDNLAAFEALGAVRFEIAVKSGGRGGEQPKFCYLSHAQIAFLLTLTSFSGRSPVDEAYRNPRRRARLLGDNLSADLVLGEERVPGWSRALAESVTLPIG